ncbi:mitochondrial peripheral inner membrane protein [Ciborinia camelliae]|nr:mitochondrial peripheral inner membrane protein [Ciborinia camelliae]
MGKAPPPRSPQYFAVIYTFFIPIPGTEILYWVKNAREQRALKALFIICEIGFFATLFFPNWWENSTKTSQTTSSNAFDAPRFTKFTIVSEEIVSSTSKMLTIRPKATMKSDPYTEYWENGLWSVEFKQPLLQIARSYTPLPPDENTAQGDLCFLIRKEPNGEMSNYLFGLQTNSELELRGPHVEFDLPHHVEEVVFLAGGTGIAPALQVVHTLLEARKSNGKRPRIRIMWANRRREDCIGGDKYIPNSELDTVTSEGLGFMVQRLQRLQEKYPENLQVDYVVDEEGRFIDQKMISQATHPSSEVKSGPVSMKSDAKLFFVSGPEGFINHFAGPKIWWNGRQDQGELGGVLGRMGIRGWKVFKL